MSKQVQLSLSPAEAVDEIKIIKSLSRQLQIPQSRIRGFHICRKSIDARKRNIRINMQVEAFLDQEEVVNDVPQFTYPYVDNKPAVIVVGSGPAGLYAALKLIDQGLKPIVIERGTDVSQRKKDVALLNRNGHVNPNSNYCFGEGGAGTFSDGKLYTRSKKRGNIRKILENLCFHGANKNILYEAHPHIGTDKLPTVIKNIRNTILEHGGEVHFNCTLTEIIIENDIVKAIKDQHGNIIEGKALILATGHSANDVYELLQQSGIKLEAKAFAMGVRVEHPQGLIDSIQYNRPNRGPYLPPASYSLVSRVKDRGVYSFCMCPGGFIVPSATIDNQVVVNGMSPSKRNSPYANSGIVVEIKESDLVAFKEHGVLAGLKFRDQLELEAKNKANNGQQAPAQRLDDFVTGKHSGKLPDCSYNPGIVSSSMHQWLPTTIREALQQGFKDFNRKMRGFVSSEALILGVESRTSSPLRIPRNKETYQHVQIKNLYPCGEGAGYSGGIISSAIDGENAAQQCAYAIKNKLLK